MTTNKSKENKKSKSCPTEADELLGRQLCIARKAQGLSQEKVAQAIGLTYQQIQKYERGINRVSAARLHQFSKVFNRHITFFYEPLETHNDEGNSERAPVAGLKQEEQKIYMATTIICDVSDDALRSNIMQMAGEIVTHIVNKERSSSED